MKRVFLLSLVFVLVLSGFSAPVDQQLVRDIAFKYYIHQSRLTPSGVNIEQVTPILREGVTTFYMVSFSTGGFVMVAADDASIPILAYSTSGDAPEQIDHPALSEWLESYSDAILEIQGMNLDNTITRVAWDDILAGRFPKSTMDVQPLLNTTWDQGCYYNAQCPSDPPAGWGMCGRTWTGCVTTAMAQIMKFHNFPPQGVMSHSYIHPTYEQQSANFGATTYNWSSMPNNVTSNNTAVATIMYHAGVSVNMNYGVSGSGAYSEDVPNAMSLYFNYHPDISIAYKDNYPNVEDWKQMLRDELDASRPIYYSGYSSGSGGHAFVCDGYQTSSGKFHFNWGWSGSYNGYFSIGALNPGGNNFNQGNVIVYQIKPYNPNLIVRITDPYNNQVVGVGATVPITAEVLTGTATTLSIYIDDVLKSSVNNSNTISYNWVTTAADMGTHIVKAVALNSTDTVFFRINVNVGEWITQNSGF